MEISAIAFIEIMKNNFNFAVEQTEFGPAIKLSPKDAFIFSNTTGAGYLDNDHYPYTPKGLTKLFYNAFDYNFVTGIFDNLDLRNTPHYFAEQRPYLTAGFKYILPVEYSSEDEFRELIGNIYISSGEPQHYLIQRIDLSKKGFGMEPFMEYLTCKMFEKMGYIVENQIPLTHSTGSPDFGGYRTEELSSSLRHLGGGLNIIELSMLRDFKLSPLAYKPMINRIIVGEAKTSTKTILHQIEKYIKTQVFNRAYVINPLESSVPREDLGLLTIDKNYSLALTEGKDILIDNEKQNAYKVWLQNYIKYYLIANLTNDEFTGWYLSRTGSAIGTKFDISAFINSLTVDEIFVKLSGYTDGIIK